MFTWFRTVSRWFVRITMMTMNFTTIITCLIHTACCMTKKCTYILFILNIQVYNFEDKQNKISIYIIRIARSCWTRCRLRHIRIHGHIIASTMHRHRHTTMIVSHRIEMIHIITHWIRLKTKNYKVRLLIR